MKRILLPALVGIGAFVGFSSASAAIVFDFGSIVTGAPQGGPLYARITLTNAGADTVSILLENTAQTPAATGQAIMRALLNVDPFVTGLNVTSGSSKFTGFSISQDGENDAGSFFDLRLSFATAMGNRVLPGDSVLMTATGTGLTESSFNTVSGGVAREGMIHLINIPPDGLSAKVSTGVPEPATFAALGLGALALVRRRRRK